MRTHFSLLVGLLLMPTTLIPPAIAAPAIKNVSIGDPAHPDTLPDALQAAYTGGARRIVIRPGTYVLPSVGHTVFSLNGWKDTVISARGVTFVQTDLAGGHNTFDLINCAHVTIVGPTLTQTEVTHYQGRVLQIGNGTDGKGFCDWRPDAGYPVPPADMTAFPSALNVVDAHTRLLKVGTGDFYHRPMEARGDGTFRVHFEGNAAPCVPGDWIVGRYKISSTFKFYLTESVGCTLQDLTLLRNGFAPIREADGGGNHFLHCRWLPGPRPEGATEDPLVCDGADGFHSTGTNPGPDIENCVFQGVLLDDCIAIHGMFQTVKSVAGRTLTVNGTAKYLAVGQPVRISNTSGFFAEAKAVGVQQNPDATTTLVLDRDLAVPVGAKLSNPMHAGPGYKIVDCQLGGTRSRGILVKADNGLVKNNTITNCGMSAVSIGPEYYWNEADYCHGVTVAGNTIQNCGGASYGGGAVFVHGDGALGNHDIVIKNNHFVSNYQGDVQIEWTDGASLAGNTFHGPNTGTLPASLPIRSPVALANCRAVSLHANLVGTPHGYKNTLVELGANVDGVLYNDLSGIRVAADAHAAARPLKHLP